MEVARLFAEGLGPAPCLPESLHDVQRRAELVHKIDAPLIPDAQNVPELVAKLGARLGTIANSTMVFLPEISDGLIRLNVGLRLWAGCISAAKTIALETRSGVNTSEGRSKNMVYIEEIVRRDAIYAAGVEAAPAFKRLRGQAYSLDGVPENSIIRRFSV